MLAKKRKIEQTKAVKRLTKPDKAGFEKEKNSPERNLRGKRRRYDWKNLLKLTERIRTSLKEGSGKNLPGS